jgi:hypothetical protein
MYRKGYGYGLFEVYFDENGNMDGHTQNPECGWFETIKELREAIELMYFDAKKRRKVLEYCG